MKILATLASKAGRGMLVAQKYSPQLLLGFGSVTFIETVVVACVTTTRASEVLDRHNKRMEDAKKADEVALPEDNYDIRKEKAIVYAHTAVDMTKLYAPAIGLGALTLTCFFKAFGIMQARYTGAVAAYNLISSAFDDYRGRVKEELGDQMDRHFMYGTEVSTIETTTMDGKKKPKTEVETIETVDPKKLSGYAALFDRHCKEWDTNLIYNMKWLRANETAANDILQSRGHIFLNEVYDMIGLPHTPAGAVAGWVKGSDGDGYVSFGLDDPNNESAQLFINGKSDSVLLDFNVDGIIFDKI